jgi:hypothetical protein
MVHYGKGNDLGEGETTAACSFDQSPDDFMEALDEASLQEASMTRRNSDITMVDWLLIAGGIATLLASVFALLALNLHLPFVYLQFATTAVGVFGLPFTILLSVSKLLTLRKLRDRNKHRRAS